MIRRVVLGLLLAACVGLPGRAAGATYYMSPTGNDGNSGTSASTPWQTFTKAVAPLAAGDTLILLDGEYNENHCGSNGCGGGLLVVQNKNGTSGNPITIKAQNQYKAWIHDHATYAAVTIYQSSYIVIEGLRLSTETPNNTPCNPNGGCASNNTGCGNSPPGSNALWVDPHGPSHHITLRKLLAHNANQNGNCHLIEGQKLQNSLFEDIELYNFHRHAIGLTEGANNNTLRRIYCSSRWWPFLYNSPDPYPYPGPVVGQDCVAYYVGNDNFGENMIAEDSKKVVSNINRCDGEGGYRHKAYSSIGLNNEKAFHDESRGVTADCQVGDSYFENIVAVGGNDTAYGFWDEGGTNTQVHRATMIGNPSGFAFTNTGWGYAINPTFTGTNWLAMNNTTSDVDINEPGAWSLSGVNAFNTVGGTTYNPSSSGNYTNKRNQDPGMGGCYVYIPDGSPMKGIGAGGLDIGANVLWYSINGVEDKTQPLWDTVTGQLKFCGPIIQGVNDANAGHSCTTIHQRLHVNSSTCPFPAAYGGGGPPPPPPPSNVGAWWKMDEGTSTTLTDSTGNGFTGTLVNTTNANWVAGHIGSFALQVNSTNQYASITGSPLPNFTSAYTICTWALKADITPASGGSNPTMLNLSPDANNSLRFLEGVTFTPVGSLAVSVRINGSVTTTKTTAAVFSNNAWVHACVVNTGSTLQLYTDGVARATTTEPSAAPSTNNFIGTFLATAGNWGGTLDDMQIYGRAFSASEIQALYAGNAARAPRHRIVRR